MWKQQALDWTITSRSGRYEIVQAEAHELDRFLPHVYEVNNAVFASTHPYIQSSQQSFADNLLAELAPRNLLQVDGSIRLDGRRLEDSKTSYRQAKQAA